MKHKIDWQKRKNRILSRVFSYVYEFSSHQLNSTIKEQIRELMEFDVNKYAEEYARELAWKFVKWEIDNELTFTNSEDDKADFENNWDEFINKQKQ